MNKSLLHSQKVVNTYPADCIPKKIFVCPEESLFYSQCLERMVLNGCDDFSSIVEFGAGDGSPVINSLLKSQFNGLINGYELNSHACEIANLRIESYNLRHQYIVHNSCFFNRNWQPQANCLIANPPYLPAISDDLYMPSLHGGTDGSSITKRLLSMNCPSAMLMISAYSDPVGTIEYAIAQGYQVDDFITSPMNFGYYSSEPKVKQRIAELRKYRKAFYSSNIYILAGILFKKRHKLKADLSKELIKTMTAL
ncbi:SAM-dependent methyltransferase [Anabaena catenula]|uniref:SAM-dependent methyltransferase n=1 Tax=Anabaena catenula FACHB-362 TaxID=2692877 RepID=A0ABR8IYI7_9NOST|nr:SAM-dependent methyltransferase [Anabaena catenula]MBD2691148.1 SAM-dependent methyltransferase [Anabaena catenula FACHB-362]